jgi:hypothetical protein
MVAVLLRGTVVDAEFHFARRANMLYTDLATVAALPFGTW